MRALVWASSAASRALGRRSIRASNWATNQKWPLRRQGGGTVRGNPSASLPTCMSEYAFRDRFSAIIRGTALAAGAPARASHALHGRCQHANESVAQRKTVAWSR